jgi:hypothetical protein
MSALSSSKVSYSMRSSSESSSGGRRTVQLLQRDRDVLLRPVAPLEPDDVGVPREQLLDRILELREKPFGADLDDVILLARPVLGDDVDDRDVVVARQSSFGGRERGDRALEHGELALDDVVGHLWLQARHLQLRPVGRSTASWFGNSAVKVQASLSPPGSW